MTCPKCKSLDHSVIDSRTSPSGDSIRRRRRCDLCGHKFTTYERVQDELKWSTRRKPCTLAVH